MHRSRFAPTSVALVTVLGLLLVGLGACADPNEANASNTPALAGPPPTATATPARSVKHRAHAGLARMSRAAMIAALAKGPKEKRFAHLDLELRGRDITITGRGDMAYSQTDPAIELEVATSCPCASNMDMIVRHGRYYFQDQDLVPDGRYFRLDPTSPDSPLGQDFGKVSHELDPLSVLLAMRPAFRESRYTGRADLHGIRVTTYSLVVDTRVGVRARGIAQPADLPDRITYHLWFDKSHMLRNLTVRSGDTSLRTEMSAWGRHVDISAPTSLVGVPDPSATDV